MVGPDSYILMPQQENLPPRRSGRLLKKFLRWFLAIAGGLVGLVLVAFAVIYLYVGHRLDTVHDIAGETLRVPEDAASVAAGERLARLRGCMGGCHGRETGGNVFFEVPDGSAVIAPDLGLIAAEYSVAELERAIRHGIRPDGTTVLGIMPSSMFSGLSDDDTASIIGFLKSRPPGDEAFPASSFGPLLRTMMLFYAWQFDWDAFPAETIQHDVPHPDSVDANSPGRGRYLATTVCTECHGDDLRGSPDGEMPSLAIVVAYSRDDFATLMKTGTPIGGRELDLMKTVAVNRFAYFTEAEVDDLHAYLLTLASDIPQEDL